MRVMTRVGVAALIGWPAFLPLTVAGAEAADPCAGPTIVGTDADDHVVGTDGADVIAALGGDDVVEGLGGDDVICGGDGGDRLVGGPGNDRLHGQEHVLVLAPDGDVTEWRPDVLDGGAGDDYLDGGGLDPGASYGGDFLTFEDAPQGVTVDLWSGGGATGDGTDTIVGGTQPGDGRWNVVGSPYDDTLRGSRNNAETLVGGQGDDVLTGDYGRDTLVDGVAGCACAPGLTVVGRGDDDMDGGGSGDVVRGGRGRDNLAGGLQADRVWGGAGDDTMAGNMDADHLWGGAGDDHVDGDYGPDHVRGGPGGDTVSGDLNQYVEGGSDVVRGGPGNDLVVDLGRRRRDWLRGGGGDDVLTNAISARRERVFGGAGNDTARRAPEDPRDLRMVCRSIEVDRTRGACR